jgi:ribosomal protein S18 acetylase RimI-like enzyme
MIEYRTNVAGITPDQLDGPFFVGWPNGPTPETHLRILEGSDHVVLAVDASTHHVVGFVTAITDGFFMAFLTLLEVVPEYQGRGIGSELVRRLLNRLQGFYSVDAMTDPELQPFYRHLGLEASHGVSLRNYGHQSGQ